MKQKNGGITALPVGRPIFVEHERITVGKPHDVPNRLQVRHNLASKRYDGLEMSASNDPVRMKTGWFKTWHDPVGTDKRMNTIRSFIAIPMETEVAREAIRLIKRLREPGDGIKWVPTDNLHLTLKFLGEVNNTEVPRVCQVVRDVCDAHPPFELKFSGAGGLPAIDRARVIHAGVEDATGSLTEIVMSLEKKLADLGFKPEPRDYRPHLTLGRAKGRRASEAVVERVKQESDCNLGSMFVNEVQMIASFLDKKGPTYQVMDTIDL